MGHEVWDEEIERMRLIQLRQAEAAHGKELEHLKAREKGESNEGRGEEGPAPSFDLPPNEPAEVPLANAALEEVGAELQRKNSPEQFEKKKKKE
jgi:hypothetical protein